MATEIVASTDELLEKKVDEEVNGQKSVSLSNEHDKDEDAQGSAASFSKKEGEAKGDENKDESAVVVVENIDGSLSSKASFADNLKEEKELIHDSKTISVSELAPPTPDEVKSQPKEPPPTESTETSEDMQPKAVETIEELSNTTEADLLKESQVEVVKGTEYLETSSQKVDKHEPPVTEVQENSGDPEKESQEAEQLNTVVVSDPSAETDEKPCVAKESTEPIVQQVHENSGEQEKEPQENTQEVQQPTTVAISAPSAETNEKLNDAIEKPEPIVIEVHEKSEKSLEPEEGEQPKTAIVFDPSIETNGKLSDVTEKSGPSVTEVQERSEETKKEAQKNPQEAEQSNIIAVSDSVETTEKLSDATEKIEPIVTEVHEKSEEAEKESQENPQVAEQPNISTVSDSSVETNEKLSDVMEKNTREPTSLKVEKTDAQVSLDEETQATTTKLVESSSHADAEKAVEEDGNKESSCTQEIKSVSKEVVEISKDPEQAFIKHEATTDLKQETEYSAPINIEEKVAANDDNKQQGTPVAAEGSSREAEVEIKKDDRPTADKEKQGPPETKVEIRETLASKLEEKVQDEAEPPTKENDASIIDLPPKETPSKPTQKQSNNIISKVKKSLIKAKKAITGKSPTTSKTISSQAKGDIIVK